MKCVQVEPYIVRPICSAMCENITWFVQLLHSLNNRFCHKIPSFWLLTPMKWTKAVAARNRMKEEIKLNWEIGIAFGLNLYTGSPYISSIRQNWLVMFGPLRLILTLLALDFLVQFRSSVHTFIRMFIRYRFLLGWPAATILLHSLCANAIVLPSTGPPVTHSSTQSLSARLFYAPCNCVWFGRICVCSPNGDVMISGRK